MSTPASSSGTRWRTSLACRPPTSSTASRAGTRRSRTRPTGPARCSSWVSPSRWTCSPWCNDSRSLLPSSMPSTARRRSCRWSRTASGSSGSPLPGCLSAGWIETRWYRSAMTSDAPDPASPRWQLDSIFPAIGSDAYASALEEITAGLDSLDELAEANGIRGENTATAADIPLAEQVLRLADTVHSGLVDVISYLYCRISTDSFDEEAQAALSLVQPLRTRASILSTRVTRWLAGLPLAEASASSDFLAQHRYALERAGLTAQYLLAPEAEAIVAAIAPSGGAAFARLHDALISRETIRVALPGRREEEHSVAGLGTFSSDPDAKLREAAYRAEL